MTSPVLAGQRGVHLVDQVLVWALAPVADRARTNAQAAIVDLSRLTEPLLIEDLGTGRTRRAHSG